MADEPMSENAEMQEFLVDELGMELEEGFLEDDAELESDEGLHDEAILSDEEVQFIEAEEAAKAKAPDPEPVPEPEAPAPVDVSIAAQQWKEREAKRQEHSRVQELEAQISAMQAAAQQPQPQPQPQPAQPEVKPEPDRNEDEAAWFVWKLESLEAEKNVMAQYLIQQEQQRQHSIAMQQQAQAQQQAATQFIQEVRQHEAEWAKHAPGYEQRADAVMKFITNVEARHGGTPEEVNQRVQKELMSMLWRARQEGKPPALVVENIYATMAESMGINPAAPRTTPPPQTTKEAADAFRAAFQAQQEGATGTLAAGGGNQSALPVTVEDLQTGQFSAQDAQAALDKVGVEGYLDTIRRAMG